MRPAPIATRAVPVESRRATLEAIGLICLSGLLFVTLNSMAKSLSATHNQILIVWARYFFHVATVVVVFPHRLADTFRVPQIGAQVGRSCMLLLSTVCNFAALIYLPLADVASIVFTAPIIVAVLAVLILGERVSLARWLAIGVGFAGAMMIVRPGGGALGLGTLLAFGCAFFSSLYQVTTRMVRNSDPVVSLLYGGLVGMVIYSLLVPFWWEWPTAGEWLLLASLGVLGAAGHMLLILALQRAEASRISPFTYIQLIWSMLASLLVFGDPLSLWTVAGSAVIATSGLFMYRLGQRERRAAEAAAGAGTGRTGP